MPTKRHAMLAMTVCWSVAACAPEPRPPAPILPPPPAAWSVAGASTAWPAPDWWHGFGAPELDALIAQAEATNDDLAAAKARLIQADAQARIAGAALLPQVGADVGGADTKRVLSNGVSRRYASTGVQLEAAYQLDLWGRGRASVRAARAADTAAVYDLASARITVIASLARAYLALRALDGEIADAQGVATAAQQVLGAMDSRVRAGTLAPQAAVQQREVAQQAQAALPPLMAARAHLVIAIAELAGQPASGFVVKGGAIDALALPPVIAGIPAQLLVHRPDVAEQEQLLAAAGANIDVARRSLLPAIDLTASGGLASVALSSMASGPTPVFNIGADILAPIFDGGRLRGQVRLADGRYSELAADYRKSVLVAMGDVEDALSAEHYAALADAQQDEVSASTSRDLAQTQAAVAAGTLDITALWRAQGQMAQARALKTQTALARAQGLVALYVALGGGWAPVPQPPM